MASTITSPRRYSLPDDRWKTRVFESVKDLLDDLSISLLRGKRVEPLRSKPRCMVMNINTAALAEGLGIADRSGSTSKCFAKSFPRPERIRAFWKPAEDMRLGITNVIFRRTCGEGFRHRNCGGRGSGHRVPLARLPSPSSRRWSIEASANSTSRVWPN